MTKEDLKKRGFEIEDGPFEPTWESLKQYRCPEWFKDAKLGIWAHWGPQAVPGEGDWYARNMYVEGHEQYKYHLEHYGHPSKFGFKDIIPLWKAENFDPEALIKLYKKAGAKYFAALAVHCDNFDCWDSAHHRWNSVNMGPKKDIVGLWCDAARKHGLKFAVTEHLVRSYNWFNTNKGCDKEGPYAGIPYDGNDPAYQDFYFPPHDDTNIGYPNNPPEWWKLQWYKRVKDLVEKYRPDLIYIDGGIPFDEVGLAMVANYYNNSLKWHNGKLENVLTLKDMRKFYEEHKIYIGDYQEGIGVLDVEKGVVETAWPEPWQTCTCIGIWFYNKHRVLKTSDWIIKTFVDIVSKNGNLLLNFPPKPDGTLDEASMKAVEGLADWMAVNSEAIYSTRPWKVFAEGPTRAAGGYFKEKDNNLVYTPEDFRFTKKGDTLYAILMAWPESRKITIKSLAPHKCDSRIDHVELLGCKQRLAWCRSTEGLEIELPEEKPCESAWCFKIRLS